MKILMIQMIFLFIYTNQVRIKESDFKESLFKIVKENKGICSGIDNDFVKNSSFLCLLPNSQTLKDIKSQFETIDYIASSLERVAFKTEAILDTIDKTSLAYSLSMKDISQTVHNKIFILNNEEAIVNYTLLVCNNFIYSIYLKSIDYFKERIITLECKEDDCKEKDQEAVSKINEVSSFFSHLLTAENKKNLNLIFKSIDTLEESEIKLLCQSIIQLRGWIELDSVKPSLENESNCIASALNSYDENQSTILFDIWKKDFTAFVSKAVSISPIQPDVDHPAESLNNK